MRSLFEYQTFDTAKAMLEETVDERGQRNLFMKGIFIQGDVRNHNQRVYPVREIANAVQSLSKRIAEVGPVPGELDHPQELTINSDRIAHSIVSMWMEGNNGMGKLKILPTPCGNIARALLENGVKLGVSSRGSGNVDYNGSVSDFDIVTVDIVVQPSAPQAYPKAIYESLYNMRGGAIIHETARHAHLDMSAKKQLDKDILSFIKDLKIK